MGKLLLTIPEASEATGISRSKLYELMASGQIESVSIGRSRRIPVGALEKFIDLLRANAEPVLS